MPSALALLVLAAAPLAFEKNQGAFEAPVRFVASAEHLDAFLLPGEARLQVHGAHGTRVAFSLELEGAPRVEPSGLERLGFVHSRYVGPPSRWSVAAPMFAGVRYRGVWPGVDAVLHAAGRALELDFALAPFADARAIAVRPRGARIAEVTAARVVLEAGGERVELQAPHAFQNGKAVPARYERRSDGALGFVLGAHDRAQPVTVDPIVATLFGYLGGDDNDSATAIALDDAGFVTVVGNTQSVDFPHTLGTSAGGIDVFVTRLNGRDGGLVYSTYLGGDLRDTAGGVALEADGTAVVVGTTLSGNFPNFVPSRSYDGGGGSDGFVVRVDAQTGALLTATYLGGIGVETLNAAAVDATGAAWVGGSTTSASFRGITVTSLFSRSANSDGLVIQLQPDAGVTFLGYLGGAGTDVVNAVGVAPSGLIYAAGQTGSADFPLMNELQERPDGGSIDGFITVLSDGPAPLVMSTFFGGPVNDYITSLAFTVDGGLYVSGWTSSSKNPFYGASLHQTTPGADTFVARLSGQPLQTQWVGVIAGGEVDTPGGIAVDARDNLYAVAHGGSMLAGITPNSLAQGQPLGSNGYFAVIAPDGSQFFYLTYVGGDGDDALNAIAVQNGLVAMAGQTNTPGLPVVPPGSSALNVDGGSSDVLLLTLPTLPPPLLTAVSPDAGPIDGGTTVNVSGDYFLPDASVWFGPLQGRVTLFQQNVLHVTTPASPPGPVDVTVLNPDGQRAVLPGGFVFTGVPFDAGLPPVARVTPSSQSIDAGTPALIDGSASSGDTALGFAWTQVQGPTAVDFDGGAVLSFVPPEPGSYAFTLVVSDLQGRSSAPARATVTANGVAAPLPTFHPGCGCASTDATALLLALLFALKGWSRSR